MELPRGAAMNNPDELTASSGPQSRGVLPLLQPVSMNNPKRPKNSWPRILLVHGTMDRSSSFKKVARHLSEFEVISYDRRGYGNSQFRDVDGNPRKVSWQIHLDDLTDMIDKGPTVVFGHSYGGTLALLAAERHVENLLGVVTFEPPLSWWQGWSRWSAHSMDPAEEIDIAGARQEARRFMIAQIGEEAWKRLPAATKEQRESEGVTMVSEMYSMAHLFPVLDPAQISVPAVVARSENAPERHVKGSLYLAENIPRSRLEIVSNTSHGVHLRRPEKVADLIRSLIAAC